METTACDDAGDTNVVDSQHEEESLSGTHLVVPTIPHASFNGEDDSNLEACVSRALSETGDAGYMPDEAPSCQESQNGCQYPLIWEFVPQPVESGEDAGKSGMTNQQVQYQDGYPTGYFSPYYHPNMQGYIQNGYFNQGYLPGTWISQWCQPTYQQTDDSFHSSSSTVVMSGSQSRGLHQRSPSPRPRRYFQHHQGAQYVVQHTASILKIVDEPGKALSASEREEYQLFKEIFKGTESLENYSLEQKQTFEHVVSDYARYAGIPEYVDYVLGEYDGNEIRPRQKPNHIDILSDDLEEKAQQVKDKAKAFAAYYQSCEWDRTDGWDVYERVTLLDIESLKIGQPEQSSQSESPQPSAPTMYVVLFLQLPKEKIGKSEDGSPVPCCETKGDLLETIVGKGNCKTRCTRATFIKHKWVGEFSLCGYKKDPVTERTVPKVFRGRQDVGAVYETIFRYEQRKKRKHETRK